MKFMAYEPAIKKELAVAYDAFLQVNRVFPEKADGDGDHPEIYAEYLKKLMAMAGSMKKVAVHDALPEEI